MIKRYQQIIREKLDITLCDYDKISEVTLMFNSMVFQSNQYSFLNHLIVLLYAKQNGIKRRFKDETNIKIYQILSISIPISK